MATAPLTTRTNVLAVIAFICAFFVSIVGAILGIIALRQIKRTGELGSGLAKAAIAVGFAFFVLNIGIAVAIFVDILRAAGR